MCTCRSRFLSKLLLVLVFAELMDSLGAHILSPKDDNLRFHQQTLKKSSIRGVNNANEASQFIELTLVIDENSCKDVNRKIEDIYKRYKTIVNVVNSLFQPYNLFVALINIKRWSNNIKIDTNLDIKAKLNRFKKYIHSNLSVEKEYEKLDHIQLVSVAQNNSNCTAFPFYANKNRMCNSSVGIILDFGENESHTAGYLARILAHSLRIRRNTEECTIQTKGCIKWNNFNNNRQWLESNSCIDQSKAAVRKKKFFSCLNNQPKKLFKGPTCGNSFIENGEDCDCGLVGQCDNPCCDPKICKKRDAALCAFGECCDLKNCTFRPTDTICRSAKHSCDLDEYCNGESESCPTDFFKNIGENCSEALKCYSLMPECNGTAAVGSSCGKVNGVCDSEGLCQCSDASECQSPDHRENGHNCDQEHFHPDRSEPYDLIVIIFPLAGALCALLLLFLLVIVIRRWSSPRSQTQSMVERNPYCVHSINEITLPLPTDAFYSMPNDNNHFQAAHNAYATPDMMHLLPPLSSFSRSRKNTESAESWHVEDYATIPEYAEMRHQIVR